MLTYPGHWGEVGPIDQRTGAPSVTSRTPQHRFASSRRTISSVGSRTTRSSVFSSWFLRWSPRVMRYKRETRTMLLVVTISIYALW